jgi:hypothetical protein
MIYVLAARKLPGSAKSIMRYSFPINLDRAGKLTPSPSVVPALQTGPDCWQPPGKERNPA